MCNKRQKRILKKPGFQDIYNPENPVCLADLLYQSQFLLPDICSIKIFFDSWAVISSVISIILQ